MSKHNTPFSILILSLVERIEKLHRLLTFLDNQISDYQHETGELIEVIVDIDNGKRSIAEKRNHLLQLAKGTFLCFIDDDDKVSEDFVARLGEIVQTVPTVDCITFNQSCIVDNRKFTVEFGLGNPITSEELLLENKSNILKRPPYHMCLFKSAVAKKINFIDAKDQRGKSVEDIEWLLNLYPHLTTEFKINRILHHYQYDSSVSRS